MTDFSDLILDDKITCKQLKMQDIIDNRLPIAVENLDLSHLVFEDGELPDLSFIEIRSCLDCSHTNLTSFKNFPDIKGSIDISNTMIPNLNDCPPSVKEIEMSYTNISSFSGCPQTVESIDAWKTNVDSFDGLPEDIRKVSVGRTQIRDLSKCPKSVENLTADYLDVSTLKGLPENLKVLSIAGSSIENFDGIPETLEEISCEQNPNLTGLDGLNLEILKGIAIINCPNILTEEIDAYHDIIKANTLLEKQEILEAFLEKKESIVRQNEIEKERRQYK